MRERCASDARAMRERCASDARAMREQSCAVRNFAIFTRFFAFFAFKLFRDFSLALALREKYRCAK